MEVENTLAKKIDTAGQNASYDAYCRNLLVNRQILARILKTCVKEFHDCPIKDIEEKYIEGTPKVHEVAVHRDESVEFIDGIGKEDVGMKVTGNNDRAQIWSADNWKAKTRQQLNPETIANLMKNLGI